jgi:hypothetical protein
MIRAEHLENAERALSRTYLVVPSQQAHERVLFRAGVEPEAYDSFARHHQTNLFKQYLPDIDPRHEPAIMTMLMHFFAIGAVSQRLSDGRSS